MYQLMRHLVFYSCSSTLDLSFFMVLLSICESLLCDGDPSWWSRHIDFQVYIIKLQSGFCRACLLQCFFTFEQTLYDVLNLEPQPCAPCVLCVSRHIDFETSCLVCKSVNELSMTSSKKFYRFVKPYSLFCATIVRIAELW